MTNKTYNVIKWIVLTVLPALSALVGVLGKAYGWEGTDFSSDYFERCYCLFRGYHRVQRC